MVDVYTKAIVADAVLFIKSHVNAVFIFML